MEKNKSFKLIVDRGLAKDDQEILSRYWTFDGEKFPESIGAIAKDYNRHYTALLQIVGASSRVLIQANCASCPTKLEPLEVRSQTKFKAYFHGKNYCPPCQKLEKERRAHEQKEEEKRYCEERDHRLENAVLRRAWLKLTLEEARFLLHLIESPYQNIKHSEYAQLYPSDNSEYIDKIMHYELIHEDSPYDMDDIGYHFSPRLPEQLKVYLKEFEKADEYDATLTEFKNVENEHIASTSSGISFELKDYNHYHNSETHINTGTFIMQQDTLIKAGTTCVYALQPKENKNMLLSIIPFPNDVDS